MNKKNGLFLLIVAALVGSFLGSYLCRHQTLVQKDPLTAAKSLIDDSKGDQAKLSQASDLLHQEILLNPSNLSALFLQGRALQQRGLIDLALKSYEQYFMQKTSIDFAANYNAGELYELKGDLPNAEKRFLECIGAAPKEQVGWERLITILLKEKRTDDAKDYFKSLKEALPSSDAVKRLTPLMPQ